jgi:hypothetical protein
MSYDKCPTCKKYGWLDTHKCAPVWEVRIKGDEEWSEQHGDDPEDAAADFAERLDHNSNEYEIVSRGGDEFEVRKPGETEILSVRVYAQMVPTYTGHVVTS